MLGSDVSSAVKAKGMRTVLIRAVCQEHCGPETVVY